MTANSQPATTALAEPSVVAALEFLGGAVMAETATEDSTARSSAPDDTVELSSGAIDPLPAEAPASKERSS